MNRRSTWASPDRRLFVEMLNRAQYRLVAAAAIRWTSGGNRALAETLDLS
ncbi:MAG: hypothetical protein AAGG01_20960 [Planctomycetota bacterium]